MAVRPIPALRGPRGLRRGEEVQRRPYAEETQRVIDEEVAGLLREAEERALKLLGDHRAALDRLVESLLTHETVDGSEVQAAIEGAGGPAGGPGPDAAPQVVDVRATGPASTV